MIHPKDPLHKLNLSKDYKCLQNVKKYTYPKGNNSN